MAIFTNVYGDGHTPDYEGCVLDWYEYNGYDDSDWYAICWNEEKQTIDKVLFDTTRCAPYGQAHDRHGPLHPFTPLTLRGGIGPVRAVYGHILKRI